MPKKYKPTEEIKEKVGYIKDYATSKFVKDRPEEGPRQIFERRLVEEYGYSKDQIEIEFLIQKGTRKIGPADIVVFHDSKRKTFDNIKIIVETKRKERKDGIDQLRSYSISPSQEFAVWFNGKEILYLQVLKKTPWFREIPDIPKKGETLEDVGLYYKKDLKPATELKSVFEICHNYIYANEGLLKEKVFNEVLKLIFIKMADEKKANPRCEFRITDKELEELEEGQQNEFVKRISSLFNEVKTRYSDVFDPNERINLKPLTIAFIASQFQKYSLINTSTDVKGTAFQTFVYAHQRGERGEFFTPHPIVELAVKMLDPKDNEKFIDPACGSGGFLVKGMNWVKEKFIRDNPHRRDEANDFLKEYAHAYISGIDINPDLAKVAKMHMILYDDGHTGIFSTNSLGDFNEILKIAQEMGVPRSIQPKPNTFRILMTNPPFGTKGKVNDKRILGNFNLGHKWIFNKELGSWIKTSKLLSGQVPDILFIERCLELLENNGRMAIVLPDSNLTNPSLEYVREFIIQNAKILGVVSLPQETFVPHGAGVKTSVLFLKKLDEEELRQIKKQNYSIFMALCKKIGYRVLKKKAFPVYKIDREGNRIIESDIEVISQEFQNFLHGAFRESEDIYAIKYSEIEEQSEKRIDAEYYIPRQKYNIQSIVNLERNKHWKISKLGEIAQIKKGIEIGSESYKTEGIPYIRVQNLSETGFSENNLTYLDKNLYETLKSFNPQPKEILYSKDATIGIAYLVEGSEFLENKFITSGGIVRIKVKNEEKVIPEFLVAILNSEACRLQAQRESIGGVIKHLSIKKIKEILIPLPSMDYQKKITESVKKSYKLRNESKKFLNDVKQEIEEIILEK